MTTPLTETRTRELTPFIGGQHVAGTSGRFSDVYDPSTGEVQARVPLATTAEVEAAMVTSEALKRVEHYIQVGVDEGATLLADGRGLTVDGYENGFYLGPTLFDNVTTNMTIYKEEIFGPVLIIAPADDYERALAMATDHEYGNGVSIFTRDGDAARDFSARVNVGMVGVNVPIPVHAFRFYTKTKTVTSRWPSGIKEGASFVIPTMH